MTIMHGDYGRNNLFVMYFPEGMRIAAIDWGVSVQRVAH
jgi:hypothetical protein